MVWEEVVIKRVCGAFNLDISSIGWMRLDW